MHGVLSQRRHFVDLHQKVAVDQRCHLPQVSKTIVQSAMSASDKIALRLLWRKLRTSDEDGTLMAISSLQQLQCSASAWVDDRGNDGSALLHTVGSPRHAHDLQHVNLSLYLLMWSH
jgi:hypothetical protein